jgi:hypothetical protein
MAAIESCDYLIDLAGIWVRNPSQNGKWRGQFSAFMGLWPKSG